MKFQREEDLCAVTPASQRSYLKRFWLPCTLPELLHKGAFPAAGHQDS
jgi:hypothetical protein